MTLKVDSIFVKMKERSSLSSVVPPLVHCPLAVATKPPFAGALYLSLPVVAVNLIGELRSTLQWSYYWVLCLGCVYVSPRRRDLGMNGVASADQHETE